MNTLIPKSIRALPAALTERLHWRDPDAFTIAMFVIEALHPDGWRQQGRFEMEYWAYQEAQARCCSDGRNYRIVEEESGQIIAFADTSSCRAFLVSR